MRSLVRSPNWCCRHPVIHQYLGPYQLPLRHHERQTRRTNSSGNGKRQGGRLATTSNHDPQRSAREGRHARGSGGASSLRAIAAERSRRHEWSGARRPCWQRPVGLEREPRQLLVACESQAFANKCLPGILLQWRLAARFAQRSEHASESLPWVGHHADPRTEGRSRHAGFH